MTKRIIALAALVLLTTALAFAQGTTAPTLPTWVGVTGGYDQSAVKRWTYGAVFAKAISGSVYSITQINLGLQESVDPATSRRFWGVKPSLVSDLDYSILPNKAGKFQLFAGGGLVFGSGVGLPMSVNVTPLYELGKNWAILFTLRGMSTPTLQSITTPGAVTPFKPTGQFTVLYHLGN